MAPLTCDRPGEGAGWGLEGGPVRGCGALFISRSSAWGGGRGPVCRSAEGENTASVALAAWWRVKPRQPEGYSVFLESGKVLLTLMNLFKGPKCGYTEECFFLRDGEKGKPC